MRSAFSSVTSAGWWRSSGRAALCALLLVAGAFASSPNDKVFDAVGQKARALAASPYRLHETALPEVLQKLNYDTYRLIDFRRELGLWFGQHTPFQAQFFHPGYIYKQPVALNQVVDGEVRPLPFNPKYFRYPRFDPAPLAQSSSLGFAGFRLLYPLDHPTPVDEVISFLGSSYFRALGTGQTYGISARGIALNTAETLPEEFPAFTEFWLCRPPPGARQMQFFALLEGASVSGAYRFLVTPGADTIVEVNAQLFFRRAPSVFGLAPLTSMFWRGEAQPLPPNDPRPEVHDSDTLVIETSAGEEECHPLAPVEQPSTQLFPATNPRSFGLLQRDRDPAHYRDREAHYERRPSVRVESLGKWGPGTVRLLQLPATNEYNDNVVAFWQPEKAPAAGDELAFRYRLHWFTHPSNKR